MAVFVAEIEIEAHPLAAVGALGRRQLHLVEPSLEGGPYFCRNLLHGSSLADTAGDRRGSLWRAAS
jgi:hypothetical protein